MATFFLLLIYLSFISLGLPDSLLGSAWPVMRLELGAPLDAAGVVSMVICGGTIVSSLLSNRMVSRFGAGRVTAVSVSMTALALLGFSVSGSLGWLVVMAVPLGLGAGAVDAALNNYVALHYSARHMSWLHCFWGVGAFAGPMIFSGFLALGNWRAGYRTIGGIQVAVSLLLLFTLPLWKRMNQGTPSAHGGREVGELPPPAKNVFRIPGVPQALVTFLCYCGAELSVGLWGASFLVETRGFAEATAARGVSLFYLGITAGRFVNGIFANRFSSKALIRTGLAILGLGAVLLALPFGAVLPYFGFGLIGVGCAPVYPCMIHETPGRFGAENSQRVVGLQMAFAYVGSTFVPALLGFVAARTSVAILPFVVLLFMLLMLLGSERINQLMRRRAKD